MLEDCLFYKLSQEADKMQGKGNALMLLPPTIAAGETLDVEVLNIVVRQMWMVSFQQNNPKKARNKTDQLT